MKTRATLFASAILLICLTSVRGAVAGVCSRPTFAKARSFGIGAVPTSFVVADFNGDDKRDLAAATREGVSVLLGKGDGTFPTATYYSAVTNPVFVAAGDFNGDGKLDIAVANDNGVSILLSKGDGGFFDAVNYNSGGGASSLAVGDFDGDGKLDIAVANDNGVSILLSKGDGGFFDAVNYSSGVGFVSLAVGDFDGDGKLDLAVANSGSQRFDDAGISVLLGNGDGTFRIPVKYGMGTYPVFVAVGDLNGDGKADLAAVSSCCGILLLLGESNGTFQFGYNFAAGEAANAVAIADFNGDGRPELAVARSSGGLSVLLGNGDGTIQPLTLDLGGPTNSLAVAAADFNGDGKPDLAVVDGISPSISVLVNTGASASPWPSMEPMADYFTGPRWGTYVVTGDFNGDGKPDLAVANTADLLCGSSDSVEVRLGNGDGSFQRPVNYSVGTRPHFMAVGDFNGDRKLDLSVGTYTGVSILLGSGDGTFQATVNYDVGYAGIAVGDFNGDGQSDLAVANGSGISVLPGKGDGTFGTILNYDMEAVAPVSVSVGDFNRDGKPDLLAQGAGASLLLGKGDGTFQPGIFLPDEVDPLAAAVGDFNGDGNLDLALGSGLDTISVRLGNGDGTFQSAVSYDVVHVPYSVAVGDLNDDGKIDLIVVGKRGTSVLLSNGDGTFQTALNHAGDRSSTYAVATADFNGDGKLDLVKVHGLDCSDTTVWLNTSCSASSGPASVSTRIVAWGGASGVETNIPPNLTNVIAIASGAEHALALRADGTVIDWGLGDQAFAVPGFSNVLAIAANGAFTGPSGRSLALKSDGTVAERVGAYKAEVVLPPGLTNIVAIACGHGHSLVLKANGTVVDWEHQFDLDGGRIQKFSGTLLPVPDGLSNVVAIAAGNHSLALKSDGTVVTWWSGYVHAPEFNTSVTNAPPNLSNVVAIAAGEYHSLALQSDGTVVAWGEYGYDYLAPGSYSAPVTVPPDLANVVALAAGTYQSLALKADGTVVTWGPQNGPKGEGVFVMLTMPPLGLTNIIAIAGAWTGDFALVREHALALVGSGPPVLQAKIATLKQEPHGFGCSMPSQSGKVFRLEYKNSLADREWTPLPLVAGNGSTLTLTDSTATDSQRFYRVRRW